MTSDSQIEIPEIECSAKRKVNVGGGGWWWVVVVVYSQTPIQLITFSLRWSLQSLVNCVQSRETEKYPREHDEKILGATMRNQKHSKQCQVLISPANDQTIGGTFIWSPESQEGYSRLF